VILGERVLDWLLRRLGTQKRIESDLVVVRAQDSLADTPATFSHKGESWNFAAASGELTLRNALLRGGRLVAAVPEGFRIPLDLIQRAYLRRPILIDAQDIVAGLAGTFCVRISDPVLADTILKHPARLARHSAAWTLSGPVVTETEVMHVIVAAELGFDRKLERLPPAILLARWIVKGAPTPTSPELLDKLLREAHGREGEWLAWAIRDGQLDSLLAAGALAGTKRGQSAAPAVPGIDDERSWDRLRALVEGAVFEAWKEAPSAVTTRLAAAEALARRVGLREADAAHHPLLRTALDRALFEYAHAAATGSPPTPTLLDPLERNLHNATLGEARHLVQALARVAGFCQRLEAVEPDASASIADWARFARDHTAWADLAARSARRLGEHAPPDLAGPRKQVLDRYLDLRDRLNRRFAEKLAANETEAYRNAALPEPLPLHLVTRALIRPLVDAGCRVFLVVLDGCDLSSLYELLLTRPEGFPVGLALPEVSGRLGGDLEKATALHVGLSLLPTVTSHARRALFGGEIPKNPVLEDTEVAAANAHQDIAAWTNNSALRDVPHLLLLKGDLGEGGADVIEALKIDPLKNDETEKVLAVVFNGVDDALSSHETTAMGPWRYADVGSGFKSILETAIDNGWTIIVTSDHGHTPFWTTDRKVGSRGPQRYADTPLPGSVAFAGAGVRTAPIHLLTSVGGYAGTQTRGFHGGAGLEEVIVPIALLGRVTLADGRPQAPAWWTGEAEVIAAPPQPQEATIPSSATPASVALSSKLGLDLAEALHDQPRSLRVLELISAKGVITATQIGQIVERKPIFVRGLISEIQSTLQRKRLEIPFTVEAQNDEMVYRWKIRS
jgi:PglZ domain-containing protein